MAWFHPCLPYQENVRNFGCLARVPCRFGPQEPKQGRPALVCVLIQRTASIRWCFWSLTLPARVARNDILSLCYRSDVFPLHRAGILFVKCLVEGRW